MAIYRLDDNDIWFPAVHLAEEDGLLAIGGDLSPERLLLAYSNGIFPWYSPGHEKLWWCPRERYIIVPSDIHISKSMKKFIRKNEVEIRFNEHFEETIRHCKDIHGAEKDGTWITDEMEEAYINLFHLGYAVSVESYISGELAGGLYGVANGRSFFGESMFTLKENGSKIALIGLAQMLKDKGFLMIDCQFHTDHLESMGGKYISYEEYKELLDQGLEE